MTDEKTTDIIRWYLKKSPLLSRDIKQAMLTVIYRNEIYKDALQNIKKCSFDTPVQTIHIVKMLAQQALDWNSV